MSSRQRRYAVHSPTDLDHFLLSGRGIFFRIKHPLLHHLSSNTPPPPPVARQPCAFNQTKPNPNRGFSLGAVPHCPSAELQTVGEFTKSAQQLTAETCSAAQNFASGHSHPRRTPVLWSAECTESGGCAWPHGTGPHGTAESRGCAWASAAPEWQRTAVHCELRRSLNE